MVLLLSGLRSVPEPKQGTLAPNTLTVRHHDHCDRQRGPGRVVKVPATPRIGQSEVMMRPISPPHAGTGPRSSARKTSCARRLAGPPAPRAETSAISLSVRTGSG